MIEEEAVIVSVDGEFAEVQVQRRTACGSCSAKAGCGNALFSSLFGNKRSGLQVLNRIQARPGDRVVIGLREASFLRAAFALYAIPLVAMIGGAISGEWLALRIASASTEPASLIGGLLGLVGGLGWVRLFAHRSSRDPAYQASVLRRARGIQVQLG